MGTSQTMQNEHGMQAPGLQVFAMHLLSMATGADIALPKGIKGSLSGAFVVAEAPPPLQKGACVREPLSEAFVVAEGTPLQQEACVREPLSEAFVVAEGPPFAKRSLCQGISV